MLDFVAQYYYFALKFETRFTSIDGDGFLVLAAKPLVVSTNFTS